VTADTHFRAGSISKSFIASAIVQLYLDDEIDLDTPVSEIARKSASTTPGSRRIPCA
jgi:CubicO group peptidase (beta-lactamase class C family)